MISQDKLQWLKDSVQKIITKAEEWELLHEAHINAVLPEYRLGAQNLVHYMAFRSFPIDQLQEELVNLGLPSLSNIEGHVMTSLYTLRTIIVLLMGASTDGLENDSYLSIIQSESLLNKHTEMLFGPKSKKRSTRIMVTMPSEAAEDYSLVTDLLEAGMNSARVNCAHDDHGIWQDMVEQIHKACNVHDTDCKIMMDLGGPKLRTGKMIPGPKVIHIQPKRNELGELLRPARLWIASQGVLPPSKKIDAVVPVSDEIINKIHRGDEISFKDNRGKQRIITIDRKKGKGYIGHCDDSAYISTGTEILLTTIEETGTEKNYIGELLPREVYIVLHIGDTLILHRDQRLGEPAVLNEQKEVIEPAHISCTLPEVFDYLKVGEPVFINDGKIEAVIEKVDRDEVKLLITYAKLGGAKLRADKGINFPLSDLKISGLTSKDKKDLFYAVKMADTINLSFVNSATDVQEYLSALSPYKEKPGLIVKIETQRGFENLPDILLSAMQAYPVGVMIARGDLAIETGWKNFATIQDEIMRFSEAACIPVVWATQVLENLAKKGLPTRSEITDAAVAQRTECVMLNKGPYIVKAVKTLDKILRRMQKFQHKKKVMLPSLQAGDHFQISHHAYDV